MAAAAHDPGFARRAGILQSVAREFHGADKAKKRRRTLRDDIREAMRKHGRY